MLKFLGIFAIVLVYYCEINAEIVNFRHGKAAAKDGRANLLKDSFSDNYTIPVQRRTKFTTRFPEDIGSPLMKFAKNTDEALNNDLETLVVERRREKNINGDEEKNQTEMNENERSTTKMKKKPSHHSVKLQSNDTSHIDDKDRKYQKDKEGNKAKGHSGKRNKTKTYKEKDKTHTERNIERHKHTSTNQERENNEIIKKKKTIDKHKNKNSKKSKQAVDKRKDDIRIAKADVTALLGHFQSSDKDTKISTSTPKPHYKPVRGRQGSGEGDGHGGEGAEHGGEGGWHGEGGHGGGGHGGGGHGGGGHGGGGHGGGGHGDRESNYPSYISPYAVFDQMEELMKEFPDANATVIRFARTVEYNDIVLLTVTDKKSKERYTRAKDSKYIDDAPEKKIIFLAHGLTVMGMHSLTSLVKMSELKLLFSYYFKHLDKFDFYIMPLANPDGYSASRSPDHTVWNKNMSPQSVCPGVFVDRNFDIAWNATKDVSSCSQLYPGATPFSEVESKAVRDVFHYFSHKILAYIHVHSGTYFEQIFKGDAILYPRGYTESQSDDDKYIDLKGEIDEAMKNASFRVMSVTMDTLANWYGVVSGSSVDYAASVFGIPYALEFVMQIYNPEPLNHSALTQIWSRLIDTTLSNMWKSLHHASEERKSH